MVSPVVLLCWLLVAVNATGNDLPATWQGIWDLMKEEFNTFKMQQNKMYASEAEERMRLQTFQHNRQQVALHNKRYEQGIVDFLQDIDKLDEEFVATDSSFKDTSVNYIPKPMVGVLAATFISPKYVVVPDSVDWRKKGAVTPVKDQGHCEASWAFSAVGSLEGQFFRQTGQLVALSAQKLIDCSAMYGNNGCKGGMAVMAFQYIKDNGGIDTEKSYPYKARENWCKYKDVDSGTQDVGFVFIPKGDEEKLKLAVAVVGPVSVAIDASNKAFKKYKGGVYHPRKCSQKKLNHEMLLVGYGTEENGEDYWLLKNSNGTGWGIDGYMMLARNRNNVCGIANWAFYPLLAFTNYRISHNSDLVKRISDRMQVF